MTPTPCGAGIAASAVSPAARGQAAKVVRIAVARKSPVVAHAVPRGRKPWAETAPAAG